MIIYVEFAPKLKQGKKEELYTIFKIKKNLN